MMAGDRLGGYEILGVIGAGGMGEVYRARDARLQRDVAIKVLPAELMTNARRKLRFEREARALAAINHPNIATIHEAGTDPSGVTFLVMELVSGDDLSARLTRGPLPLAEALPVGRQLADALAAAHDAGIVHRDLKPANIKLRADGTVKVLDFGLARNVTTDDDPPPRADEAARESASDSNPQLLSPTLTLPGPQTADGAVVGTAAYMAPEQARGQPVDKRADIWAFGVVLFEVLADRRPFDGDSATATVTRLLNEDPPWHALPAETPAAIRRLLARCLTKDRRQRLHDIGDARLEIDEAIAPSLPAEAVAPRSRRRGALVPMAVTVAILAGVAIGALLWRQPPVTAGSTRAQIGVEPASSLDAGGLHPTIVMPAGGARTALVWMPDGRSLGFIGVNNNGRRQVFVRDLAQEAATPVAGTEGARVFAFSADGQAVVFWNDGGLYRVALSGGPSVLLHRFTGEVSGLVCGSTRTLFSDGAIFQFMNGAVGEAERLTPHAALVRHTTPFLLPGESAILYTEHARQWTSGDERVMALRLAPGAEPKLLLREAADARYLPTGHLVFLRRSVLHIVPFDAGALEIRGEAVPLISNVSQAVTAWDSADLTLAGQFAVSPQGSLAYVTASSALYPEHTLVSVDRQGRLRQLDAPARGYRNHLEVSPDGRRIGLAIQSATDLQVFAYDLERKTLTRVAESLRGEALFAAWSRTNDLAVGVIDDGRITTAVVRPDVASPVRAVADSSGFWPSSLSPGGLVATMGEGDIWIHPTAPDGGRAAPFVRTPAVETQPMWSPDGRWLAYTSTAGGQREVYLRPHPGPGEALLISHAGGSGPAWSPDGSELFYIEPGTSENHRLMSVRIDPAGRAGRAVALFVAPPDTGFGPGSVLTPYAVGPGAREFFTVRSIPRKAPPVREIRLVLNWLEEVRARFR